MSTIERTSWIAFAILFLAACDGPAVSGDAGVDDAGFDDASIADAGTGDAGGEDASVVDAGGCACGADEACVRGVCIATCGLDPSALDAALGEGLAPVASFCRAVSAWTAREDEGAIDVWDVTSSSEGATTSFTLSRWVLDPSAPPDPAVIATVTHESADGSVVAFPSGFVEIDPSGARALFGYTTSAAGFPGSVVLVSLADGEASAIDAPANFDAAWLDAERVIVNATGLDDVASGPGLYVGDLGGGAPAASYGVTGLAAHSGSVVVGAGFVVAGSANDAFAAEDYVVSVGAIDEAIAGGAPLDVTSDARALVGPEGATLSSTFSALAGRIVTTPYGGPLTSYALDPATGALSDPRVLATGGPFTDAVAAGSGRTLLALQDPTTFAIVGLLLVEE